MKGAALLLGACVALAAMVALLSSTGWVRRTALISRPVRGAEVRVLPERRRRVALRQQALCSELREQGQALAAREGLVGRDAQMLVAYQLGGQCNLDLSGAYLTYETPEFQPQYYMPYQDPWLRYDLAYMSDPAFAGQYFDERGAEDWADWDEKLPYVEEVPEEPAALPPPAPKAVYKAAPPAAMGKPLWGYDGERLPV